jgi:hypothetical protein
MKDRERCLCSGTESVVAAAMNISMEINKSDLRQSGAAWRQMEIGPQPKLGGIGGSATFHTWLAASCFHSRGTHLMRRFPVLLV